MPRRFLITLLRVAVVCLCVSPAMAVTTTDWTEYPSNPVYSPLPDRAYYPTIIKDAGVYKMWYDSSYSFTGPCYATSTNGINWTIGNGGNAVTGLANARHAVVRYNTSISRYQTWYWDSTELYSISALRYADSADGLTWANDQVLTQDASRQIVTGGSGDWNRGSYGPCDVLMNHSASNTGTDPRDYSYVMYYDGTTGGEESVGLGYSADGKHWYRYGATNADGEVLAPTNNPGDWDRTHVSRCTVVKENDTAYHMWYSGGDGSMNNGIGYASSSDGISWTRDGSNPIFSKDDGVAWRDSRTYTPCVIGDEMWFSGRNSSGTYAIGYAVPEPVTSGLVIMAVGLLLRRRKKS
ncbi:MAG: PEP-CTERM sorting domain-containing protein [Phycisphaerae bacterium]|nr:PEP-CTERM sorting domain-containing protein [Phycisphaerae bacterium]